MRNISLTLEASGTRAQRANIVPRACVGDLHPGTHVHRHGAGLSTVGVSRVQGRGEGGQGVTAQACIGGDHKYTSYMCLSMWVLVSYADMQTATVESRVSLTLSATPTQIKLY